ncbi:MAG: hypothetical protein WBC91_00800 [Phototrophicaceae bacterium]
MPIDINLDKSLIFVNSRYYGNVTLGDIQDLNDMMMTLLNTTYNEKLHLIVDVTDVDTHPTSVAETWKIASKTAKHKKMGTVIMVGMNNPFITFLIDMIAFLGKSDLKTASNYEEAVTMLVMVE